MNNEELRNLSKQFRDMALQCIPNGEGMQAFNYCAETIEVLIPKHEWEFYMHGSFCKRCGVSVGSKRECN